MNFAELDKELMRFNISSSIMLFSAYKSKVRLSVAIEKHRLFCGRDVGPFLALNALNTSENESLRIPIISSNLI